MLQIKNLLVSKVIHTFVKVLVLFFLIFVLTANFVKSCDLPESLSNNCSLNLIRFNSKNKTEKLDENFIGIFNQFFVSYEEDWNLALRLTDPLKIKFEFPHSFCDKCIPKLRELLMETFFGLKILRACLSQLTK